MVTVQYTAEGEEERPEKASQGITGPVYGHFTPKPIDINNDGAVDPEETRTAGWGATPQEFFTHWLAGPNNEPIGVGKFNRELTPDVTVQADGSVIPHTEFGRKMMTDSGEVRTVSDTGAAKGVKPERYDLIPIEPMNLLARLYGVGALKYAEHNWRGGYEWSKSYAAAMRHLTLFWNGEDIDEEMGLPHITCATFHLFALAEYLSKPELYGRFDDRYKPAEKSLKDFLIEPKYEYGIEDIELKFPTGFENEETIQKLADVIWEGDNHYTDMPWEDAWKLRDHDSFTDLSKHIYRVYNTAKRLVESGWIEQ